MYIEGKKMCAVQEIGSVLQFERIRARKLRRVNQHPKHMILDQSAAEEPRCGAPTWVTPRSVGIPHEDRPKWPFLRLAHAGILPVETFRLQLSSDFLLRSAGVKRAR